MVERHQYIVETDFLFALRPSDRLHDSVTVVLQRNLSRELSLIISGASPIEANAVMASQGLSDKQVGEAFSLLTEMLRKHRLEKHTSITISDVKEASYLRQRRRGLTFFDSLHAAISSRMGLPILSSDPIYRDLGLGWVDIRQLARR